ncbi:MAG: polysaccharide biosynthesis/export family protein [Limisphaerales bacterium]
MKTAALNCLLLALMSVRHLDAAVAAQTKPAAPATTTDAYKLLPSDKVRFWLEEDPKRDGTSLDLPVTSQNMLIFPVSRGYELAIPVDIRGKTLDDVKAELKQKLEEKYYKQATVHLTLLTQNQRKGVVYFRGTVTGMLELFPGDEKTVTQAILEKGYSDFANLKKVKVTRIDPVTKKTTVYPVNVDQLLKKPDPVKDLILQDKDIIEVPEKGIVF